MKTVSILNQKGGTAKSTTALALAWAAQEEGYNVLVADADSQGNATFSLDGKTDGRTIYDLFDADPPRTSDVIQTTQDGIDLIPASLNMAAVRSSAGSGRRLQTALEQVQNDYGYCFIDCPPQIGEIAFNALLASDSVIIPVMADAFSMQGLYLIADTIKRIKQSNPQLTPEGIVFTRYSARSNLSRDFHEAIVDEADKLGIPFLCDIRESVSIRESQALRVNLFDYAKRNRSAQKVATDYMTLFNLIK